MKNIPSNIVLDRSFFIDEEFKKYQSQISCTSACQYVIGKRIYFTTEHFPQLLGYLFLLSNQYRGSFSCKIILIKIVYIYHNIVMLIYDLNHISTYFSILVLFLNFFI